MYIYIYIYVCIYVCVYVYVYVYVNMYVYMIVCVYVYYIDVAFMDLGVTCDISFYVDPVKSTKSGQHRGGITG